MTHRSENLQPSLFEAERPCVELRAAQKSELAMVISCLQCWGAVVLPHRLPLGHEPPKNRVASFRWPAGVSTAAARSPPAPVVAVPSWSYLSAKRSPPASASI